MRGCPGAGSTQARTPICTSPPPLALHPGLDLYGFRVLSNSDRAPVLLLVLCTCLACWKLDLLGPEVLVWVWGWLEACSFLQTLLTGCFQSRTTGFGFASWTCPDQTGASLGLGVARGLWFPSDGALAGCFQSRTTGFGSASWTCPDQTGASLGLGVARGLWFLQTVP